MIVTKTPLRISLFGGGSDFPAHYNNHDGACFSIAINKYIYVSISERYDGTIPNETISLSYGEKEQQRDPKYFRNDLLSAAMVHLKNEHNVSMNGKEVTTIANVTGKGSGLGSSSSLLVGFLLAAYAHKGAPENWLIDPGIFAQWLVDTSNHIELDILKRPQGIQDAYPATYGGARLYSFYKNWVTTDGDIPHRTIDRLFKNLLLFSTKQTRQSSHILREQHIRTTQNATIINELSSMAHACYSILTRREEIGAIGDMLDRSWELKKQLSNKITNDNIDHMYKVAKQAGAIGGKVCGAGGGGHMLLFVPPDRQTDVRYAMRSYTELPIKHEPRGSMVVLNEICKEVNEDDN